MMRLLISLLLIITACETRQVKDCKFICPDLENIPDGCYCLDKLKSKIAKIKGDAE